MAQNRLSVTTISSDLAALPDSFSPAAQLLTLLGFNEKLGLLEETCRIPRQGGYAGVDLMFLLLAKFVCQDVAGLKTFIQRLGVFTEHLGQLVGRARLPSQSSASRLLDSVQSPLVRPHYKSWLLDITDARKLLEQPFLQHVGGEGESWAVFDMDVTKNVYRERGLPDGDDLPDAMRVTDDFAAPAHAGRKRGHLAVSTMKVSHRVSQVTIDVHCSPGNGDRREAVKSACSAIHDTVTQAGLSTDRVVLVGDGAHGCVHDLLRCRDKSIGLVSRLTRPHLRHDASVRRRLTEADWFAVQDSGSGPRRFAAELGEVWIPDESGSDGVTVRIVASRFRRSDTHGRGKDDQRGVAIGEDQIELFMADVDSASWPAHAVVTLYFQRSQQENGFGRDNAIWRANTTLTYQLDGFEWTQVALHMVKNWSLAEGMRLHEDLQQPTPQRPDHVVAASLDTLRFDSPEAVIVEEPAIVSCDSLWHDLNAELEHWTPVNNRAAQQGWTVDERGRFVCPEQHETTACQFIRRSNGHVSLDFATSGLACAQCPVREACNHSAVLKKTKTKMKTFRPKEAACMERLEVAWKALQRAQRRRRSQQPSVTNTSAAVTSAGVRPQTAKPRTRLVDRPIDRSRIRPAVVRPSFSPAAAWTATHSNLRGIRVRVNTVARTPDPNTHPLFVSEAKALSRGRKTWAEKLMFNALRSAEPISVEFRPLHPIQAASSKERWLKRLAAPHTVQRRV